MINVRGGGRSGGEEVIDQGKSGIVKENARAGLNRTGTMKRNLSASSVRSRLMNLSSKVTLLKNIRFD